MWSQEADPSDLRAALALSQQLRDMQRVLGGLARRLATQPPVTLMFNASGYHSMIAAYTDLQQVGKERATWKGRKGKRKRSSWEATFASSDLQRVRCDDSERLGKGERGGRQRAAGDFQQALVAGGDRGGQRGRERAHER